MRYSLNALFKTSIALLCLGFFCPHILIGQSTRIDSLVQVYESGTFKVKDELSILKEIARDAQDPQIKLKYTQQWKMRIINLDSMQYYYDVLIQEGNAYRLRSDLTEALGSFLAASKFAQAVDSLRLVALSNITIGDVYSIMGNHENSISYYQRGIQQLRDLNRESTDLATALLNAGDEYFNAGKYDEAMNHFYESSLIFQKLNHQVGSAYNLGNMGMVYAKQGKVRLAEANINEAISILEEVKDYYAISIYLKYVADIYLEQNNLSQALNYAKRSLELATKYQLKDEISKANEALSMIYEQLGEPTKSLFHYKAFVQFKDSINNVYNVQTLADLRTEFELSKKQSEVDLINEQKENQKIVSMVIAGFFLLVSILAYTLFRRNKYIKRTRDVLHKEREKSNELLRNILPEETAEELRQNGKVIAKKYTSATVLFSDFKDFTKYAEALPPEKLVQTVDLYFSEFDRIMDEFGIEKIKTIGDSYMCASGLPILDKAHAQNMIEAAKAMLEHVNKLKEVHAVDQARFDIRIGIHSGPVVAGVVGERKFAYDIWGDTVNVASRMESSCEAGKINVSETTYELLKDQYKFEERGKINIKNRTPIHMYYLKMD